MVMYTKVIFLSIWFGHIEIMDKSFWVSRCRAVEVSGSGVEEGQRKPGKK